MDIQTCEQLHNPSQLRIHVASNGWFLGGGVENSLNIFGIASPGWFMKTEYRVAEYQRVNLGETFVGGGLTTQGISVRPIVQTVSTSLVYRFNWGGPVVAKY